jgi:hypothetical protein
MNNVPIGAVAVDGSRPFAFVASDDEEVIRRVLWVDQWDGSNWYWVNLGVPADETSSAVIGQPAGITTTANGSRPYVFLVTTDGHLWVDWFNDSAWSWRDQGFAGITPIDAAVGAITFQGYRPYAFVLAGAQLWVNWWSGSDWLWSNQNADTTLNPPATVTKAVGAVATDDGGIYAFVVGGDGHLWVNSWDSSAWHWKDLGMPDDGIARGAGVVVVDKTRPYAFTVTRMGNLMLTWWTGSEWLWRDQNVQGTVGKTVDKTVGAVAVDGTRPYAFVVTNDGNLWVNWYDLSSQWQWYPLGKPTPSVAIDEGVGSIAVDSASRPYVFVVGDDDHLWVNYWYGGEWTWSNQGQVPHQYTIS